MSEKANISLSVIIPVYNEPAWITRSVSSVLEAILQAEIEEFEILVVDDGSTDSTTEVLDGLKRRDSRIRIFAQPNKGRFLARLRGVREAQYPYLLLTDSRVTLSPSSLRFVCQMIREDPSRSVWNAHCFIEQQGNPYARFWNVLTEIAFADYFSNPRTTSFGPEKFDRFPKGTTCFLVPRETWEDATAHFDSLYSSLEHANDDTTLIRWIAQRSRIQISPEFSCAYCSRTTFRQFVDHIFHRGLVFVDGYRSPRTRFFPILAGFYPISILFLIAAMRMPLLFPVTLAFLSATGVGIASAYSRSPTDRATFGTLVPVYAVFFGMGLWAGLFLGIRDKLRRSAERLSGSDDGGSATDSTHGN